jgi:2'-5' RNA ligase
MKQLFSVAIYPPNAVIEEFRRLKDSLAEYIGWFNSKNSDAHITINLFFADEEELAIWKNYLVRFCSNQFPFEISLVKTGFYPNGAFYLSPDDNARKILVELMKSFNKSAPLKGETKSTDPHMSIARKLNKNQLDIADKLLSDREYNISFTCGDIVLRRFDEKKRQYVIDSRYGFSSNGQQSLFN